MSNEALYEKHLKTVYGFFMAKTWHKQTAEDLTQEVFMAAFEQFAHNTVVQDKEKYLYGVMKLTWLTYLRQKYNRSDVYVEDIDDFSAYAIHTIEETTERSLIDRALPFVQRLPEAQKQVLLLRFRDGLELPAIAEQLGRNMNYVKTTQRRGLASLKVLVQKGDLL
jgi:RNA polymerase sigma-70 factor (ECF subfamily)